jgi:quercetin dioxygenase-like cupin family protein
MTCMTTHGDVDSMSSAAAVAPIALGPGEGEALWFLGELVTVKASSESTAGRVAVSEHLAPRGSGSPLHVHRNEDEWFYVTEGELTFWVGGQVIAATAGSFVYVPRDIPHTFKVDSEQARFLFVVAPADIAQAAATAAEYGSEVLGPPGIPV